MTNIMGAESVLVGMRPGVVSALIEAGAEVDGVRAAIDLDAAFAMLQPEPEPGPASEPDREAGVDTDETPTPESGQAPGDAR